MIITVTLNPANDRTYELDGFIDGGTNRAQSVSSRPGGKGINVSRALTGLGVRNLAMGIADSAFAEWLRSEGIDSDFVITDSRMRTNIKIVDTNRGITTEINERGPHVDDRTLGLVQEKLEKRLSGGDIVVFSGSLPPGAPKDIYRSWISLCRSKGAVSILDSSGIALREGLNAVPYLVKPNLAELEYLEGRQLADATQMCEAAANILSAGVEKVIVSLGVGGAVLLSRNGVYFGSAPNVPAKSSVGAGDAMVAACIMGMGMSLQDKNLLALAIAAGASSTMNGGVVDISQVKKLGAEIEVMDMGEQPLIT